MQKLADFTVEGVEKYLLDLLGDDPSHARSEKYVEALSGIGVAGVRELLVNFLKNGIRPEIVQSSYFHPNKFFKLGICRLSNKIKLRLHFWDKHHLEVQTPIHLHAWDFASLLVTGSYTHDIFRVEDLDDCALDQIKAYRKHKEASSRGPLPDNCFGMYKIPKRDGASGKFRPELVKYVRVKNKSSKVEKQGSIYFLGMEYPHQITIDLQEVGSMITLVITSETNQEKVFTFQPLSQSEAFDNPAPNVDEAAVRAQIERILSEIDKTYERK